MLLLITGLSLLGHEHISEYIVSCRPGECVVVDTGPPAVVVAWELQS